MVLLWSTFLGQWQMTSKRIGIEKKYAVGIEYYLLMKNLIETYIEKNIDQSPKFVLF